MKCLYCGNAFMPRYDSHQHCSTTCSGKALYERLNAERAVADERQDAVRAIRQAEAESRPMRPWEYPRMVFDPPSQTVPNCLADPDCTRPATVHGMCYRHAAREGLIA
ncbi:hypothetical protein ACLQ3K_25855 [Tsukamurella sp. DT100]|uniref:hypothetical protein n=1 Tax=Tsukamurella sp. DT100 TaxID=3393415 RepID=UPI003CF7D1FD